MLVRSRILLTGGRGTRDASLGRQKWPCHAGAADLQDRFWRDGDLLMLFRHTPQGHVSSQKRASWVSIWGMSHEMALQLFGVSDVRTIPNASVAGLWRIALAAGLV